MSDADTVVRLKREVRELQKALHDERQRKPEVVREEVRVEVPVENPVNQQLRRQVQSLKKELVDMKEWRALKRSTGGS